MFQPASYNAAYRDVLRLSRNPRAETADSPDEKFHIHASLRALYQLLHDVRIVHGIALDADAAVGAFCNFTIQIFNYSRLKAERSNPESMCLRRKLSLQQRQESRFGILSGFRICSNQREIGILLAGNLIVVPGPDLCDCREISVVLIRNETELGMHLMLRKSVDHLAPSVFQHLGIVDIILLVETRPQFQ